ncbi:MAG: DUF4190 domain-containing protein [Armatimonadota bacterium]
MSTQYDPSSVQSESAFKISKTAKILGICSLILPIGIIALIVSIIAVTQADRENSPGSKGMAITGLVTSIIGCVISPIFILSAIMYPVFSQARLKAQQSGCLSNAKQIGLAMVLYADDYDEKLPMTENWRTALLPYIKTDKVFTCVNAKNREYSYAMNSALNGCKISTLSNPANTVSAFESDIPKINASGGIESVSYRHNQGGNPLANMIFADGHAAGKHKQAMGSKGENMLRWKP